MFQTPSTILPKTRDQLLTIPYSGTNFSFCLCYFSVSVIKHWPKTMWGQSVYFSLQFMGHLEGKSGHQPKAGTWWFVDCFLDCSPWVAQFAFLYPPASHQLKSSTCSMILLIGSLIEAFFLLKFPLLKKTLACVKYTKNKHCRQGFCHTSCNNNKCIKMYFYRATE